MFDLRLTAEQLEFRDTVRDFVDHEVKPKALASSRLEPFDKPLLADLVDQASRIGLRSLAVSEECGGTAVDQLTTCIVLEELAAGDVDIATVLGTTARLAHLVFDEWLEPGRRKAFLVDFCDDAGYHLARAHDDAAATAGWRYHRDAAHDGPPVPVAQRANGAVRIDGGFSSVPNAPVAKLFAVEVMLDGVRSTVLVPRDTPGFSVSAPVAAFEGDGARGKTHTRWYHGSCGAISFSDCRVASDNLIEGANRRAEAQQRARALLDTAAINLGLGRVAFETAVDYAKLRVQGGRRIVEHQAIGRIIADSAIRLEAARNLIWKAAWALDNSDTVAEELPLATIARVYTAQAVNEIALGAAECFGAMGVMRDMPLQKYVHDSFIFLHAADLDSASKLEIAERVAGFDRSN